MEPKDLRLIFINDIKPAYIEYKYVPEYMLTFILNGKRNDKVDAYFEKHKEYLMDEFILEEEYEYKDFLKDLHDGDINSNRNTRAMYTPGEVVGTTRLQFDRDEFISFVKANQDYPTDIDYEGMFT